MSDERRQLEMARGRQVARRAQDLDRIERLRQSGRLEIHSHQTPHYRFLVDGEVVYRHEGPMYGPEWPPEALMAHIGLAIRALDIELPPPSPTHKPPSAEARAYNERMRKQNELRWKEEE